MSGFLLHILFGVVGAAGFLAWLMFRKTRRRRAWYGGLTFLLASAYLLSLDFFPEIEGWAGQIFISLGNWQSIFSSGAATLSAILYIASRLKPVWRRSILQSFLLIFKIIWFGFGLFVISELGALRGGIDVIQSLAYAPAFLFGQILIAIIMLNGFYIGKYIGFGLIMLLKQDPVPPPDAKLARRIAVSGSISLVSWYFLLAAIKGLLDHYALTSMAAMYVAAMISVIFVNAIFELFMRGKQDVATVAPPAPSS